MNEDESRAKQGQRCPKVAFRVLCLLTNGVLDIVFNLEAQVVNNVEDDNDGRVSTNKGTVNSLTLTNVLKFTFNGNKGNWETLDEGTCNRFNYASLGIKRCP